MTATFFPRLPGSARVPGVGLVLASALGALSVTEGNAHALPSLPLSAKQEIAVTPIGPVEAGNDDSAALVPDDSFRASGALRRNIILAGHETETDTAESSRVESERR